MLELAAAIDLNYDAIVVLSGDGGIHEVINGLAKHPDARKALRIPLAQVPTGSANALCVNHFGPKVCTLDPKCYLLNRSPGWV
jgi:sphingosine kinase